MAAANSNYDYEDDFEVDYEDDYENEENAHSSAPAASRAQASTKIRQGVSLADFRINLGQLTLAVLPKNNPVINAAVKRAQVLVPLIQLDYRSYELLNLPPMGEYDVYMRRFGASDAPMSQVSTQKGNDQLDQDIQTDTPLSCDKWTHYPSFGQDVGEGVRERDNNISTGLSKTAKLMNVLAKKRRGSIDSLLSLDRFLARTAPTVEAILEESNQAGELESDVVEEVSTGDKLEKKLHVLPKLPYLTGRICINIAFAPLEVGAFVTVWIPESAKNNSSEADTMLCFYKNVHSAYPVRMLRCEGSVSSLVFSHHQRATLIVAGTQSGVICLWDLRESDLFQRQSTISEQYKDDISTIEFYPSYSTAMLTPPKFSPVVSELPLGLIKNQSRHTSTLNNSFKLQATKQKSSIVTDTITGHEASVVAVEFVRDSESSIGVKTDSNGTMWRDKSRPAQIVSVDINGYICIWIVVEQDSFNWLSNDPTDLGMGIRSHVKLICTVRYCIQIQNQKIPFAMGVQLRDATILPGVSSLLTATDIGTIVLTSHFQFAIEKHCAVYQLVGALTGHDIHTIAVAPWPLPSVNSSKWISGTTKPVNYDDKRNEQEDCLLFLVGYDTGVTALFSCDHSTPIAAWQVSSVAIRKVMWSATRPAVFFCLDANGNLFVFDLTETVIQPQLQVNLSNTPDSKLTRSVLCAQTTTGGCIARTTSKGHVYLGVGLSDGTVQIRQLSHHFIHAKEDEAIWMAKYIEQQKR